MKIRNVEIVERVFSYGDLQFITEAWLTSARRTPNLNDLSNRVYYETIPATIARIMQAKGTRVKIYVNSKDSTHIIGFMVYDPDDKRIHYLYTAPYYRRSGIASSIIREVFGEDRDLVSTFTVVFSPFKFEQKEY